MAVCFRLAWLCAAAGLTLSAQTLSNASLTGKYGFRELLLPTDTQQIQTLFGTLTFNGNGGYTYSGQLLDGSAAPTTSSATTGTYSVQSGGQVSISDPLQSGAQINALLGNGVLIGSATEVGNNSFSLFVAIPAPSTAPTLGTLNGTYWLASLEFLNGSFNLVRETLFQMIANGTGGFGSPNVIGEAANLGSTLLNQIVPGVTYAIDPAGTGSLAFSTVADPTQLIGGAKTIYVSGDGSFFFGGGSGAGGQGFLIGIRAGTNLTNATLNGLFWTADLYVREQTESCFIGSADALSGGTMTFSKRLRENGGALDVTTVSGFNVSPNGSGALLDNNFVVSANGQVFIGSGLSSSNLDTDRYELFLGINSPAITGTGMFLNPQGVVNVFSYAPAFNPIAPGEFITIFGSGLPAQKAVPVPYPPNLGGVQLLINNTPAPLYTITPTQVFAIVPYSVAGATATIVLKNNAASSNTITVPLAATAPGLATQTMNGLGNAAITHADGTLVTSSSPATRGETVVMYLTGLGQVSPSVNDGAAAPSKTLATTTSVLTIYLNGVCPDSPNCDASNIQYQGLTPGYAGLYQVNFTIPLTSASGAAVPLAIQTTNGFADMVSIAIE
jgi:uncharacterized protein (TIGR03437 family)